MKGRWSTMKPVSVSKARPKSTQRSCNLIIDRETLCVYPLDDLLEELGRRWSLLVVAAVGSGFTRFNRMQDELKGISPRTLSARLKGLEEHGVLSRRVVAEGPLHTEYALTPKGRELLSALHPLLRWAAEETSP